MTSPILQNGRLFWRMVNYSGEWLGLYSPNVKKNDSTEWSRHSAGWSTPFWRLAYTSCSDMQNKSFPAKLLALPTPPRVPGSGAMAARRPEGGPGVDTAPAGVLVQLGAPTGAQHVRPAIAPPIAGQHAQAVVAAYPVPQGGTITSSG
eukprot:6196719-Pleurochrysis_carterae.AAC.1